MENSLLTWDESFDDYIDLPDEDVIVKIQDNQDGVAMDYLINKYRNFVRAKARSYFLIGADEIH